MKRFAAALTRSASDADDLVQATFERAVRSLNSFEEGTRLDSWMYRIMQNLHRNQIRDTKTREKYVTHDVENADGVVDGERTTHAQLDFADMRRLVGQLDEDHRTVLMLVAVEGYSYKDVADMLSVPIGTVTSRLARARLKLRSWMEAGPGIAKPGASGKAVGGLS